MRKTRNRIDPDKSRVQLPQSHGRVRTGLVITGNGAVLWAAWDVAAAAAGVRDHFILAAAPIIKGLHLWHHVSRLF